MKKILLFVCLLVMVLIVLPQGFATDVADNSTISATNDGEMITISTIDDGEMVGISNDEGNVVGIEYYSSKPGDGYENINYDGDGMTIISFEQRVTVYTSQLSAINTYVYVNGDNSTRILLDGYNGASNPVTFKLSMIKTLLHEGVNNIEVHPDEDELYSILDYYYIFTASKVNYTPPSIDYETTVTPISVNYEIGTSSDVTVTVNYDSSHADDLKNLDMYVYVNGGTGIVVNGTKANATSFTFDLKNISSVLLKGKSNNVSFHPNITELEALSMSEFDFANLTVYARAPIYPGPIYVNTTGDDNNEGSIDEPVASIERAIELATDPRNIAHKVIINEGTYTEHNLIIKNDVEIIGNGNVIIDAESLDRIFFINRTNANISGITFKNGKVNGEYDGGAICFYGNGSVTNCNFINNTAADKGGAIFIINNNMAIVDNCSFESNAAAFGGAIYGSDVTVNNCNFTNNRAHGFGGAIAGANGTVTNCNFINNTAGDEGGAIYFYEYCIAHVNNCNFINNTAGDKGGAIYFSENCTAHVNNCNFINNTAGDEGGAIYFGYEGFIKDSNFTHNALSSNNTRIGGAIYFASELPATVNSCNFDNNIADYGSAIYFNWNGYIYNSTFANHLNAVYFNAIGTVQNSNFTRNKANSRIEAGGAIFFRNDGSSVDSCNFISNSGYRGGAIYVNNGATIENSNFTDNTVKGDISSTNPNGGAIFFNTAIGVVNNCNFVNNRALDAYTAHAGAIYFSRDAIVTNCSFVNNSAYQGGAICIIDDATVTNCSFVNNSAQTINGKGYGGAIYAFDSKTKTIENCSFVNSTAKQGAAIFSDGSNIYLMNNTVENCAADVDDFIFMSNTAATGKIISKVYVTLSSSESDIYVGQNATVTAVLTDDRGNHISGNLERTVNFYYNLTQFDEECLINGSSSTTFSSDEVNSYTITITYAYADDLESNTLIINVKAKEDPAITATNNGTHVVVTLPNDATGTVAIKFDETHADNVTVSGNKTSFAIPSDLIPGSYVVNVTYSGDVKYNNDSTTVNVEVSKLDITSITAVKENNQIIITVVPINATGTVKVIFNATSSENVTLSSGSAAVDIPDYFLTPGDYTFDVIYSGDTWYNGNTTDVSYNIPKYDAGLTVSQNDTHVIVSLNASATGTVKVAFNSTVSENVTVDKGDASVAIPTLSPGIYNVVVTYSGDKNFNTSSDDSLILDIIDPNKKNATIVASADSIYEGMNATVSVTLPGDATGNITIEGVTETLKNGQAVLEIPNLAVGNHTLDILYSGDTKYNPNTTATVLVVVNPKKDAPISAESEPCTVGDDAIVTVTLPSDATGSVTVQGITENLKNGVATVKIPNLAIGNYTFDVTYTGDSAYKANSTKVDVTVVARPKENATITASADAITEGENATVSVTLPSDATGSVTVGGVTETVKNGVAILTIPGLAVGNHTLDVLYSGDDKYNPATTNVTIVVNKKEEFVIDAPDLTKYKGNSARFVVTVKDNDGNPIANQTVIINLNGVPYTRVTDNNGVAGMNINLDPGVYTAVVTVNDTSVTSKITILSTINGTDVTKIIRNGTQYYATFRDTNGDYLANGTTVNFNINGVFYERKVNGDQGLARLNINLDTGEYTLTAINPINGEMSSNLITVLPQITENKDLVKYYKNDSQYRVKVLDSQGKAVGANETVVFNINGVMYQRLTDANGYAQLRINLDPGNYVITAMYGNSMVSNNITVKPILTADNLVKKYGTKDPFVAHLVDGQGNPYFGQIVTFNINGVMYQRLTNASGDATLNINLQPGIYIITSMYTTNGASIGNKVTVLRS